MVLPTERTREKKQRRDEVFQTEEKSIALEARSGRRMYGVVQNWVLQLSQARLGERKAEKLPVL